MKMRCFLAPIVLAALSTALQAQNDSPRGKSVAPPLRGVRGRGPSFASARKA